MGKQEFVSTLERFAAFAPVDLLECRCAYGIGIGKLLFDGPDAGGAVANSRRDICRGQGLPGLSRQYLPRVSLESTRPAAGRERQDDRPERL